MFWYYFFIDGNPMIESLLNPPEDKRPSEEDVLSAFKLAIDGSDLEKWNLTLLLLSLVGKIVYGDFKTTNDKESCISDGIIGLYTAVSRFKSDSSLPIETNIKMLIRYARNYIHFYVLGNIKKRSSQLTIPVSLIGLKKTEELSLDEKNGPQLIEEEKEKKIDNTFFLEAIEKLNSNRDSSLHLTDNQQKSFEDIITGKKKITFDRACHQISKKIYRLASIDPNFKNNLMAWAENRSPKFSMYLKENIDLASKANSPSIQTKPPKSHKFSKETRRKMSDLKLKTYKVLDPNGKEYSIDCGMDVFCKKMGLTASCMRKVIKGVFSQHNGWTAPNSRYKPKKNFKIYSILDPMGKEYKTNLGLRCFCKEYNLHYSSMVAVIHDRKKQYKGWTYGNNYTHV